MGSKILVFLSASFLAGGSSDQSFQLWCGQGFHVGGLVEGRSGGWSSCYLERTLTLTLRHIFMICILADIVVSRGHSTSMVSCVCWRIRTGLTEHHISDSLGSSAVSPSDGSPPMIWRPLWLTTSLGLDAESVRDVAGSRDDGTIGAGAVPLRSVAQMMGQQKNANHKNTKKQAIPKHAQCFTFSLFFHATDINTNKWWEEWNCSRLLNSVRTSWFSSSTSSQSNQATQNCAKGDEDAHENDLLFLT